MNSSNPNESSNDKTERLVSIASLSAKHIARTAQKQRVSRRLLLAQRSEKITITCEVSGVVSIMDIPAIPGYSLIWTSPIASPENCRGMTSLGMTYLRKLDTQILAGMLIVIADDYSLFTYQPSDSGAQKNAVLRTAGKDCLINALLLIEDFVHSNNVCYLPRLSLIMDAVVAEGGIEARMTEWMKTVASYILKAEWLSDPSDQSPEDTYYSTAPKRTIEPSLIKNQKKKEKEENWNAINKKWKEQREYKADIKTAKDILKTLSSTESISAKLMGLLKSIFTEDSLLTMDSAMRLLVASKMESFTSLSSSKLIDILRKDYPLLRDSTLSLDLELDEPVPSMKEDASMLTGDGDSNKEQGEANSIDVTPRKDSPIPVLVPIPTSSGISSAKSLIERIREKKQQVARELEAASLLRRSSLNQTIPSKEEENEF